MRPVERSDPDGADYGWVMQMIFVATTLVRSPIVAVLPVNAELQTWSARAEFAIRVGTVTWFVIAAVLFVYVKWTNAGDGGTPPEAKLDTDIDAED